MRPKGVRPGCQALMSPWEHGCLQGGLPSACEPALRSSATAPAPPCGLSGEAEGKEKEIVNLSASVFLLPSGILAPQFPALAEIRVSKSAFLQEHGPLLPSGFCNLWSLQKDCFSMQPAFVVLNKVPLSHKSATEVRSKKSPTYFGKWFFCNCPPPLPRNQ